MFFHGLWSLNTISGGKNTLFYIFAAHFQESQCLNYKLSERERDGERNKCGRKREKQRWRKKQEENEKAEMEKMERGGGEARERKQKGGNEGKRKGKEYMKIQ
jgi:flagellar motor protein MotB